MSRSGYYDDADYFEQWRHIRWRGAVLSAIRGKRGQAFLRELVASLDAMPEQRLIAKELETQGAVCAIGSVGIARGVDMTQIDPEDYDLVANTFGIATPMAQEILWLNDDAAAWVESPESRWHRMRAWARSMIKEQAA